jgi:TM2 domain-containing membrane protein YozV
VRIIQKTKLLFVFLLPLILVTSCSIEKRVHMSGYHIEWKNKKPKINSENTNSKDANSTKIEKVSIQQDTDIIETEKNNAIHAVKAAEKNYSISVKSITKSKQTPVIDSKKINDKNLLVAKEEVANNETNSIKQDIEKKVEEEDISSSKSAGSNQLVAMLLCIFVGLLGIHRFYLGHIGIGILQLLTAGGCGIWTLIDLILIITGDLKPKDGEYTETL